MARIAESRTDHVWSPAYPETIDWHAEIDKKPVPNILDDSVARFPDVVCADFMGKCITYREVGRQVDRAAKGLAALGVGNGTRVGLFLPNCPYYVIAYFAVMKTGGVVVNFNPLYAEREIEHQLNDSGAETMITLDLAVLYGKLAPLLDRTSLKRLVVARMQDILPFPKNLLFPIFKRRERARIPTDERHVRWSQLIDNDGQVVPATTALDDPAVLQYTGGTTGVPKGAVLTHGNISANVHQAALWFHGARPGQEIMMGVLPFFHVFAMTVVMMLSIRIGARIIMMPRFELNECMRLIHRKRATLFPAVPTIYTAINNHERLSDYDLTSLRYCLSGGAALPVEVKTIFEEKTGCSLVEGYGLTEASPVVCANPLSGSDKAGSIGLPLPGTEIEVVSLDDGHTVLGTGERGELCVRGPQVMKAYWNRPDETEKVLVDGRLHTGDVAYIDEDGYTFIVDRIKDLIIASGYNIYPRNVEEAIYQHPSVSECIVAGLPDTYRGQTVKAYIKLSDGATLTADDLKDFLKDKLSSIEMPKHVEFRQSLPKTMIGKLDRKALLKEEADRNEH